MAKLGTVFVELSLDDKVYKQKLSETLTSVQATTKGIEKSWQVLGQKSDEVFNAQRRSYENALTLIKNSHNATKQDIIRAEQAAASKIKSINEQQFGHQTTMLEGLKKNWIAASVAIGAAWIAASKAIALMDEGAKALQAESSFKIMANQMGANADRMILKMKELTRETIDDSDMMQKAVKLMTLGYNPEQIERFSAVVLTAANIAGTTATDAYERLADAIGNRAPKALVQMGAVTREQMKIVTEAINNGADSTALFELALANLELKQKMLQGTQNEATISMQRFHASVNDTKEAIGKGLIVVAQKLWGVLQAVATASLGAAGGLFKLISHLPGTDKARWQAEANAAFGAMDTLANQSYENMYGESANKTSTASKSEIKAEQDKVSAIMKRLAAYKGVNKAVGDAAKELERIQEKAYLKEMQLLEDRDREEEDYFKNRQKLQEQAAEDYSKLTHEELIASLDPIEKIKLAEKEKFDFLKKLREDFLITEEQAGKARELIEKNTAKEISEINQKLLKERLGQISDGFGALQSACLDIASVYAEGSESAKKWEEAAHNMEIAQRAVAVVNAVATIANQGLGDPYTAFVRIATMAAAMGSLLASIGESVGGSSASVAAASSRSTALGSEDASQSIINSLSILADTYNMENIRLKNIYDEIRDLNNNITGLVTSIVRTGGIGSAQDFGITTGATLGTAENMATMFMGGIGHLLGYTEGIIGQIEDFLSAPVIDIGNFLFGGGTTTTMMESGIEIGNTMIKSILNGASISAQKYALIQTVTKGGLFEGDDVYGAYVFDALDSSVTRMLTVVFKNLGNSLIYIAQEFGTDVQKVYNYVFESTKLNLQNMSTEEINKTLSEWLSSMSDVAVEKLFGDVISQYQKLNEGLLETAIRLISDKETIAAILELTNQTFSGTTSQLIKFSDSLIKVAGSLDNLTDAFSTYYDAFFTDAEKQADYKKQLQGVMGSYGFSLPTSRMGYRGIIESLNLTTDAGMAAYYALMAVSDTADKYYDYLENASANVRESDYATKVEYLRAVKGYASGGVASGLAWVGEHGRELAYFDSPTKIYSNSESGKVISQGELLAEIKGLREDLRAGDSANATHNSKSAKYLRDLLHLAEEWNTEGLKTTT